MRRTAVDALLGLAASALLLVGTSVSERWGRGRGRAQLSVFLGALTPLEWVGAALCLAAVATRRTWPIASWAALLIGIGAYLSGGGQLAFAVVPVVACAYTLVRRTTAWLSALLIALAGIAYSAGFWVEADAGFGERPVLQVATALAWSVAPALIGLIIDWRRDARASARADELNRVAYEERLRIARDIHDVVGHSLSLIALQSGVALRVLDANPGQVRESLEAIRSASTRSLAELRHTLSVVRSGDAELSPASGLDEIAGLVAAVRATGRTVSLDDTAPRWATQGVQLVAHRVVQEALTNAVRHAPSASISVWLGMEAGQLVVRVVDDGPVATVREGNGLRGMRERVASVDGRLEVAAQPGGGVLVEARLPLGEGATI